MKINYAKQFEEIVKSIPADSKPKLLLHSCCAVCSAHVLSVLVKTFNVTVLFFNPNIDTKEEYDKRLNAQIEYIKKVHDGEVSLIHSVYAPSFFYKSVQGLHDEKEGGKRCVECFKLRLDIAKKVAILNKCDYFTTTLTVSPHKNAQVINEIGLSLQSENCVRFLPADFKKNEGFKHSMELAKLHNIYTQNYCGCTFSQVP